MNEGETLVLFRQELKPRVSPESLYWYISCVRLNDSA